MIKKLAKSLILTVVAAVCLMSNCLTASAAEVYTVPVTVKYGQTEARTMLDMINKFRTGSDAWYWNTDNKTKTVLTNLKSLEYDYGLEEIAMQRAAEIAVSWGHTRPDGTSCFTATSSKGTTASGENIAAGYGMMSTAKEAFVTWQETNEPYSGQGHRRNMLNSNFTHVGVAHVVVNGYHYWVQEFGYSASGVSKTTANDSNKTVNVKVDSNQISSLSVTPSSSTLKLSLGKTANVPTASVSMLLSGTWGSAIKSTVTPDWSVSGSAVTVSGGKITTKGVGTATLTATVYGKKLTVTVTVECTDHKWGSWSTTKEATCTDKGTETRKCTLCGKTETRSIDAKGHSFGAYSVTKAATCTEKGTETRKCSACSKTETRSIDAKGHSFGAYSVTTAATCTEKGTETRKCSACSKTETRSIDAKGHSFGAYSVTTAATCTEKGTETRKCSACSKTETRSIDAKGHSFGEYKVVSKPTADKEGLEERACSTCGKTEQRTIAKLPPVTTTVTDKAPATETTPAVTTTEVTEPGTTEQTTTPEKGTDPVESETTDDDPNATATVTDTDSKSPDDIANDVSSNGPSEEVDADDTSAEESGESDNDDSSSQPASDVTAEDSGSSPILYACIAAGAAVLIGIIIFIILAKRRRNDK